MKTTLYIQNLNCDYCKIIITHILSKLTNITNITIKRKYATVTFEHKTLDDIDVVKKVLSEIGFPSYGEKNNFIKKTKSYTISQ